MITDYDLEPRQVEKLDKELKERIGIEIEHEPFLTDKFSHLFMKDVNA